MMMIQATELYVVDNGRIVCGAHMGATAKASGYDLSGQRIMAVSIADRLEWSSMFGRPMVCETCASINRRAAA